MTDWKCVLRLDSGRTIIEGCQNILCNAIQKAADLRIYTAFKHGEHIDPKSDNMELVQEVSEFPLTYLLDGKWTAAIMTWRQPVNPSYVATSFGPPSMSFFLYNQDGSQAIARPYLDGRKTTGKPGPCPVNDHSNMPKYHQLDNWDADTNAPSSNFIYDFEEFRYYVRDDWRLVLSHTPDGKVIDGSVDKLAKAFTQGCEMKVGIRNLCSYLAKDPKSAPEHEVFVRIGAGYYYTDTKLFVAATYPLTRVAPAIPLRYASANWDFGWVVLRTDGLTIQRICDPFTLKFTDKNQHCAIRWFAR